MSRYKRIPGAFAQCSSCGGRRKPNDLTTECHTCYQARQRRAPRVGIASDHPGARRYRLAYVRAEISGHDMGMIATDEDAGSFISWCRTCLGFLVGDPCGEDVDGTPTPLYGDAFDIRCPGAPPVPPARRRDPMDEAAVTPKTNEPVPADLSGLGDMSDKWAWDEPGWERYGPR